MLKIIFKKLQNLLPVFTMSLILCLITASISFLLPLVLSFAVRRRVSGAAMSLITVAAGAARFLLLLLLSPPGNVHLLSEGTFTLV